MESRYAVAEDILVPRSKQKKPGFFKRWLFNQVKQASQEEVEHMNTVKMASAGLQIGRGPVLDSDKGIRFQVYKAQGGFVIETSSYDRNKDRHYNSLHIINDDEKFGDRIEKIITLEALKQ